MKWSDLENSDYSEEQYIGIVTKDPFALPFVPRKKRTKKVIRAAMAQDGNLLAELPPSQIDPETVRVAIEASCGQAIEFVPEGMRTPEVCLQSISLNGKNLSFLSESQRTEEICLTALRESWLAFEYFPPDLQAKHLEYALSLDGRCLKFLQEEDKTERICNLALNSNGEALMYVPYSMRHTDRCLYALQNSFAAYSAIPDAVKNRAFFLKAVTFWPDVLKYVPHDFMDTAMITRAVSRQGLSLKHVPEKMQNRSLVREAVLQDGRAIFYAAPSFQSEDLTLLALHTECFRVQDIRFFWSALNDNKKTPKVQDEYRRLSAFSLILRQNAQAVDDWLQKRSTGILPSKCSLIFNASDQSIRCVTSPARSDFILDSYKRAEQARGGAVQLFLPGLFEISQPEIRRKILTNLHGCICRMTPPNDAAPSDEIRPQP